MNTISERIRLAKIDESLSRAYFIALVEAAGGFIHRDKEFVLTIFPYDNYPYNGIVSPQFEPHDVTDKLEEVLRLVRGHRVNIRFRLGPSTRPSDLAQILEMRGLKKSYNLTYMGIELSQMKRDFLVPDDVRVQPVDNQDLFLHYQHPLLGEIKSPKKKRILASFQKLGERKPKKYWTFMIEKAGKPVGIAALYFYRGNVGITDFVIIKEFHRQGIGTALLQYVCQFAEERDANAVVLGASTQGAKFYPRFGFEHLGRFPTYLYSREMQRVDEQNSS